MKTNTATKTFQTTSAALFLVCAGAAEMRATPLVHAIYDASEAGWNEVADWQNVGPQYANLGTSFSMSLPSGLSFEVSSNDGRLERRDQGTGWLGNFFDQEPLLRKARGDAPIEINFTSPVCAFGTQVQNDIWGGYSAWAEAYDADNHLLATAFIGGYAGWTSDGSAPFLGFVSGQDLISRIVIGVNEDDYHFTALAFDESMGNFAMAESFNYQAPSSSFAINCLMLMSDEIPAIAAVPEVNPAFAGAAFTACGFAGLWLRRRKA